MFAGDLTDYEMGQLDYKEGFGPLPDFDQSNTEDVEYMRGYNDSRNSAYYIAGFSDKEICATTRGSALAAYAEGVKDREIKG